MFAKRPQADFQSRCVAALLRVLEKHGYSVQFESVTDGLKRLVGSFRFRGNFHQVEIYVNDVSMTSGDQLFEAYTRSEYESEDTLIKGFSLRLDRYLSGQSWDEDA